MVGVVLTGDSTDEVGRRLRRVLGVNPEVGVNRPIHEHVLPVSTDPSAKPRIHAEEAAQHGRGDPKFHGVQ
jgi:hypothetical protein